MRRLLTGFAVVLVATASTGLASEAATYEPASARHPASHLGTTAGGASLVFRFSFDAVRRDGGRVTFLARGGYVGTVRTAERGEVRLVPHAEGSAVRFPDPCAGRGCPRALVEIPHSPALNPRRAPFSFGAGVRLRPGETTRGSNLMQKGRFGDSGLWKLQVDTLSGRPSCVVSDGGNRVARVLGALTVADGTWHRVRCERTRTQVSAVVDGVSRARRVRLGLVANRSAIRVGSPGLAPADDQFHGTLDDVFLRVSGR
jgi:hypothetical protein